ncbi:effector-associated domain 2-containing protein [Saccharothrix yanglingensis]|uniref:Guanylate cyclase domain-containing protein n=1 Tax=Saccharothrix yanglingensis TaxID=659496 RepID=A0ABU0X002_9PSEU|nr:hypothetical protein [Saccharothrix yanglingensis]MDQ2585457.1 hypothetical protein [Saccharothrix yanglingensis]
MSDDESGRGLLISLVDALSRVPVLADRAGLDLVVRMMSAELREALSVEDHPTAIGRLFSLAEVCHRTPERLAALVRVVAKFESDSRALVELRHLVAELTPLDLFPTTERARLFTLLAGVVVPDMADIYRAVAGPTAPGLFGPATYYEVFRVLETLNAGPDGVPRPLVFVEHIAMRVGTEVASGLREWNDAQAAEMGFSEELSALRVTLHAEAVRLRRTASRARRPVSRSFLVVDVEDSSRRTNLEQLELRQEFYRMLYTAIAASGWSDEQCVVEDRGDGAMLVVDAQVFDLFDPFTDDLLLELLRHNAQAAPEHRVRLRIGVHHGFVHVDEHGWVGDALTTAFRIVNSGRVKIALREAEHAHAVVVVSDVVYRDVIRHGYVPHHADYRRLDDDDRIVWLRVHENGTPPA